MEDDGATRHSNPNLRGHWIWILRYVCYVSKYSVNLDFSSLIVSVVIGCFNNEFLAVRLASRVCSSDLQ
mgnify:CR=1 FL=1